MVGCCRLGGGHRNYGRVLDASDSVPGHLYVTGGYRDN